MDYSQSHAVLIGVARYTDVEIPDIPAAANSLSAVARVLADSELCGWPEDRITPILNPPAASLLAKQIRQIASETAGVLVIYFVGHGTLSQSGELCCLVSGSDLEDPDLTGLEYRHIQQALSTSHAQAKIVILDCCYSGKAIQALGAVQADIAGMSEISGAYTLTAADRLAHVVPIENQRHRCTSFTEAFVDTITCGVKGASEFLTLSEIYQDLNRRLISSSLPRPNQRGTSNVQLLPFSRNAAYISQFRGVETFALAVTEDEIHFDLNAMSNQVSALLLDRERQPLTIDSIHALRRGGGGGVYCLSLGEGETERIVYLGASDSLLFALTRHFMRLSFRCCITPQQVSFRYLFHSGLSETFVSAQNHPRFANLHWNQNGFAGPISKDAAEMGTMSFSQEYPIDLNVEFADAKFRYEGRSLSDLAEVLDRKLPFVIRVDVDHLLLGDELAGPIETSKNLHDLLVKISRELGDGWLVTALPGSIEISDSRIPGGAALCYFQGGNTYDGDAEACHGGGLNVDTSFECLRLIAERSPKMRRPSIIDRPRSSDPWESIFASDLVFEEPPLSLPF
ncbi:caspase domain-containing protein [Nocardia sp. NPDC006044]|uniref:caspase family protein n=1 Tax=Nocardia sp. NPDC006044 TaxID=3364306 RepID=UPI0036BFAD3F